MSTSLEDLDVHTKLMNKLSECVESGNSVVDNATQALEKLNAHNSDAQAHADIRAAIAAAGNVSGETLDEKIAQHDTSDTAHADLFLALKTEINNAGKAEEVSITKIAEHNSSDTAHSDIRSSISELVLRLGDNDIGSIKSDLTVLKTNIENSISQAITDLQSVDAKHDSLISANMSSIETIKNDMNQINDDIDAMTSGDFIRQEDLDKIRLRVKEMDVAFALDYAVGTNPSFLLLTHTVPTYVGKNKLAVATLNGIVKEGADASTVTYSIAVGEGDFQVTPTTGIKPGDSISIRTGSTGEPGDIRWFCVTATDSVTGDTTKRAIAFMVTRPLDLSYITLRNLPTSVEPGTEYPLISVRNLAYSQNNAARWTYSFDALESELLFTPSDVNTNETLAMTAPSQLHRGSIVTFRLYIHDVYGDDQHIDYNVKVNEIPGAEDFVHTLPTTVVPGKTYQVKFSGIKSVDGVAATYEIGKSCPNLTWSKTENILANENVAVKIASDVERGATLNCQITSIDTNGVKLNIPIAATVNTLPSSDRILTTLPDTASGGATLSFTISGGTDSETASANVTYTIDSYDSGLVFDISKNITPSTVVHVSLPKVSLVSTKSFSIYTVDALREKSEHPKNVSISVNPIYVPDTPTILSPASGSEVNANFSISWTGYTEHTDI